MELGLAINLVLCGLLTILLIAFSIGEAKEEKKTREETRKAA